MVDLDELLAKLKSIRRELRAEYSLIAAGPENLLPLADFRNRLKVDQAEESLRKIERIFAPTRREKAKAAA